MRLIKEFFSMRVALLLLLIFAAACAYATFIEKYFDTQTAWAVVYKSNWFAFIQIYLGVNLLSNLFRYKLFRKEKIPVLLFHISFLFILVGAGMTRYLGYEGILHIRNGDSSNEIVSQSSYIEMSAVKNSKQYISGVPFLLSQMGNNDFSLKLGVENEQARLEFANFIPNATLDFIDDKDGEPLIVLVVSKDKPTTIVLRKGDIVQKYGIKFIFDDISEYNESEKNVYFGLKDDKFYIKSTQNINTFTMQDSSKSEILANELVSFEPKKLYSIDDINFAPKKILLKGKESFIPTTNKENSAPIIQANLTYKNETKQIDILAINATMQKQEYKIQDQIFSIGYGQRVLKLPFDIKLIEFQLERYPGSKTPMSYASEVMVEDKRSNLSMPYRIYMNHVLDYDGYRFFQSSYDMDELGTVLSVNKDPGKIPTYFGYFLLGLGLFLNIINKKSRFRKLSQLISQAQATTKIVTFLALFLLFNTSNLNAFSLDKIDKKHADYFGTILTQGYDGRIKPLDTLANEILSKIYKKTKYNGKNANQVLLSMILEPDIWRTKAIIKIKDDKLKEILGLDKTAKYASFDDFFDKEKQMYKIAEYAESANRKSPSNRNTFDKDIIDTDERVNVSFYVYTLDIFSIFPKIADPNNKWYDPQTAINHFPKNESDEVRELFFNYLSSVDEALKNGDWEKANENVSKIKSYQVQFASKIIPTQTRVSAEILFNKYNIFENLTPFYLLAGGFLLICIFLKIAFLNLNLNLAFKVTYAANLLAFILHTMGLIMRWYIAGHAPWSNSYESMIYIAWALSLSGIVFARHSLISLALTSILAGITLFAAHLSWLSPQITTLMPVLKSYWLTIHVSVITASYGFLGLCALLGIFTQILFIIRNPKLNDRRNKAIDAKITEATRINEMAMILGLSLLVIGNFLGGVWANESWGRYWGWDSKETWALISILVYASVVHFRFIKTLNSQFAFSVASSFAYWVIIMTYFGVNFYLSGMHSYAAGEPIPIPKFVWVSMLVMFLIFVLSFFKRSLSKSL